MQHGEFYVHGVIDSPCYPNSSSFAAYLYPSVVPGEIQKKMADISKKLLTHIGLMQKIELKPKKKSLINGLLLRARIIFLNIQINISKFLNKAN